MGFIIGALIGWFAHKYYEVLKTNRYQRRTALTLM